MRDSTRRKVLVLNSDYTPFSVTTSRRGLKLVMMERAELLKLDQNIFIRTVTKKFNIPGIIRLKRYIPFHFKTTKLSRKNIFRRDGFKCAYCGSKKQLSLDHIKPKAKGGQDTWTNLVTCCFVCNNKKGSKSLEESDLILNIKPKKPNIIFFIKNHNKMLYEHWISYMSGEA